MTVDVEEEVRAFRARRLLYLRHGHDREAATRFVAGVPHELRGPVLDVGTGKGLFAIELARRDLDVVTVDVDARERALAQRLAEESGVASRITFDHGDGERLPYADGQFGCVAMMDVLHHLASPRPVLLEMARVVSANGSILVADFDEHGFALVERIHRAEGRTHPRTAATVSQATDELKAAGCRLVTQGNGHQHDVVVLQKDGAGGLSPPPRCSQDP